MVPGEGLEFRYPTENKQVIENYASHKRRILPIRGYLVRIRYTPYCPQFALITVTFIPHTEHIPLLPGMFSQIDPPLSGAPGARLFQKADWSKITPS
jgi:hypothetical protein